MREEGKLGKVPLPLIRVVKRGGRLNKRPVQPLGAWNSRREEGRSLKSLILGPSLRREEDN